MQIQVQWELDRGVWLLYDGPDNLTRPRFPFAAVHRQRSNIGEPEEEWYQASRGPACPEWPEDATVRFPTVSQAKAAAERYVQEAPVE